MEKVTTKNFLGIPVEGEISYFADNPVEQKPLEDFQPILQAVLEDPFIVNFGWTQFTPYFNDGEACIFHIWGFWAHTVKDLEYFDAPETYTRHLTDNDNYYHNPYTEGIVDYESDSFDVDYGLHPTLGGITYRNPDYVGDHKESYTLVKELSTAVQGGHFNIELLKAFGDPAKVTVSRDGITVDYYEHD